MADLYLKRLETERKALWATCRLKGLPKDSAERQRIAELDRLIQEHQAKRANSSLSRSDGDGEAQPARGAGEHRTDHPQDGGGASPPQTAHPERGRPNRSS